MVVAGVDQTTATVLRSAGGRSVRGEERACPWIDLSQGWPDGDLPLGLSANARHQIRRGLRMAEQSGPLEVKRAGTRAEAEIFFAELAVLHKASWRARAGNDGAFVTSVFSAFVDRLITAAWTGGRPTIDVLRITAGSRVVGVLLMFLHRDHVFVYQSGFPQSDDNREKLGLVSHVVAARMYRGLGFVGYHFMAGEQRFKQTLGNRIEYLYWLTVRRPVFADVLRRLGLR
jgi:CelD/BcsL family acetyltransferase involved in cellulose biosynthesis